MNPDTSHLLLRQIYLSNAHTGLLLLISSETSSLSHSLAFILLLRQTTPFVDCVFLSPSSVVPLQRPFMITYIFPRRTVTPPDPCLMATEGLPTLGNSCAMHPQVLHSSTASLLSLAGYPQVYRFWIRCQPSFIGPPQSVPSRQ